MRLTDAVVPLFEHPVRDILAAMPEASAPLRDAAQFRQRMYKHHSATRSVVFKWLTNDWRPGGPFIVMSGNNLPPALVSAVSDVATALESRFDGRLATLMLAELVPGGEIVEHRDMRPALTAVHRCHLPVVSNKDVSFIVDGHDYYLEPGIVYEFDNTRPHGVQNRGGAPRVHLICDIMPAELAA